MTISKQLINARELYNNGIESDLTDAEYDRLEEQLLKSDPANIFFTGIGATVRGDKVKLPYPMGSLTQVRENDYSKWIDNIHISPLDMVISSKMDGVSVLIIYDDHGEFQISYSRGDGLEGQDISRHISSIKNVPSKIQSSSTVAIRSECIISKSNFELFQLECEKRNYKRYKNPRNAVAGFLNSKTIPSWVYSYLEIISFEVIGTDSKTTQFTKLGKYGFDTVWYTVKKSTSLTDSKLESLVNFTKYDGPLKDYEQDGVVIDIDDSDVRINLNPNTNTLNPEYSRKFKVREDSNIVEVEVVKVHWSPSKNGLLKPRIEIIPIELNGVTISYTTGFNAKYIIDNKIGPGSQMLLTRSGDVIPYILSIINQSVSPDIPSFDEFGEYSLNDANVDFLLLGDHHIVKMKSILSFFQSLDIDNLGEGSIKKLISSGYDTIANIINMKESELIEVIGKNGVKIFNSINKKFDNITQYQFMGSLPFFPGIGKRKFEKIYDNIGTFDTITEQQILQSDGFDTISTNIVLSNIQSYYDILTDIDRDIIFQNKVIQTGSLDGQVFVFTGIRDKSANLKIESEGGTIGNSINNSTTYLVAKDPNSTSSKFMKARKLDVKIITLTELHTLLETI